MSKRLLVLSCDTLHRKRVNPDMFDRIVLTSDVNEKIQTKWFKKVKTLSDYENELKFSYTGFEEAHDLVEQWKRIPVNYIQNKQLAELLKYKSISVLDVLQSNLQIYYLSRIICSIKLVEKIIEYEKPTEIFFNNISDHITRAFFVVGQAQGVKVHGEIKSSRKEFYANEILPFLRFSKGCCKVILNKFQKRNFKKTRKHNKKPVIFLNFNRRNLYTAMPVYKEMERRGTNCLFIQNGVQGTEYLIKNKVNIRLFNEFNNFKVNIITYLASRKMIKKWRTISEDPNFQEHFIYNGINCWEVFREIMAMVFSGGAQGVVQNVELTKRILKTVNPSAIVSTCDRNSFVKSVFMCSSINHIPTLMIQFGSPIGDAPFWMSPVSADIMCVESSKTKQFLEEISGNQGKIVHTGQPRFDSMRFRFLNIEKNNLLEKYNIDNNREIVLFISVPYSEKMGEVDTTLSKSEYVRFLQCFYNATKELLDVQFVIKPHPNENTAIHKEMVESHGRNDNLILMEKEADTFELIHLCDLLITSYSISGLEAVVLDKPVITINLTGQKDLVDYAENGVAIGIYDEHNLRGSIYNALYAEEVRSSLSKARKHYILDYLLDGKAKERIGNVIEDMIYN